MADEESNDQNLGNELSNNTVMIVPEEMKAEPNFWHRNGTTVITAAILALIIGGAVLVNQQRLSKQADIECDASIFEIGGKSKTASQLRGKEGYLVKDDILIGDSQTIPLYLFGFLS